MKVLFISAWYPHRNDPMSGLFVRKHAEAISIFANVAIIYVVVDKNIKKIEITKELKNEITEIIAYFPAKNTKVFRRFLVLCYFIIAYIQSFKILHKTWGKPDIVQANIFTRSAAIAYIYKLLYKKPFLVIEHWTRYFRPKTFNGIIHKYISQFVAKKASAIMPVTEHLMKNMIRHGLINSNYHVINNVVDDIFFENKPKNESNKKIILNVTCFDDEQKNLSGLLRVIGRIFKIRQDFILYMVGIGVDFETIINQAVELELYNKSVFFTGLLQGDELSTVYYKSDFLVLFSNFENIPVVISESLICGKPVISSNVGGISEHINELNGILVERNNENELFNAITYMLDNYKMYDSLNIAKNAKNKYSYYSVGEELYSMYKSVLHQTKLEKQ